MASKKTYRKTPSRRRYEEQHPTRTCRLNKEDDDLLDQHLKHTGRSFADFVRDHLKGEVNMVTERVEILASRQVDPSLEERVRCLEDLVHTLVCFAMDYRKFPPFCPRCEGQQLLPGEGREVESNIAHPWVPTWKCPNCGYFINTYKRINPESISGIEPDAGAAIPKRKHGKNPR